MNGLVLAEKYYTQYGLRARELKASGKKVLGYLSALSPVEIMTAVGTVPIMLKGNVAESITKADAYTETMVCPFERNVFDAAVKGKYGFLNGMVLPHQCDSIDRTDEVRAIETELDIRIMVTEEPQNTTALGAAITAWELNKGQ